MEVFRGFGAEIKTPGRGLRVDTRRLRHKARRTHHGRAAVTKTRVLQHQRVDERAGADRNHDGPDRATLRAFRTIGLSGQFYGARLSDGLSIATSMGGLQVGECFDNAKQQFVGTAEGAP